MNWDDFLGNDHVIDRFQRTLDRGRLASSFLFVGDSGIGKRTFATLLAKSLLCENSDENSLQFCSTCASCAQVDAMTHPDFETVSKPKDKNFIPVDLLIGDREHRMREGLCHRISLKAFSGGRKIAIIDDADFLNQEGANCLLKTLEEPPNGAVIILIGTSEQRQLPTIRSRCQVVRFQPLIREHLAELLQRNSIVDGESEALALASIADGSITNAIHLNDPDVHEFREAFLMQLATLDPAKDRFIKELTAFVDAAGKEATDRRVRMRMLADWAIALYRFCLNTETNINSQTDDPIIVLAVNAIQKRDVISPESAADLIQRCLETQRHIAANANQATLLESWLSDLGKIARGQYAEILD